MPAALTATRPRRGDRGRARRADLFVLPIVGVGLVVAVGAAILTTSTPTRPRVVLGAEVSAPAAPASVAAQGVRAGGARGDANGYRAAVQSIRVGGAGVSLDVRLTTEGEPASAPSAHVELTGRDRVRHRVALSIVAAGHWVSGGFPVPPGRYELVATFDRKGGPVVIRMTIQLL